jgi:hypothetical protein
MDVVPSPERTLSERVLKRAEANGSRLPKLGRWQAQPARLFGFLISPPR